MTLRKQTTLKRNKWTNYALYYEELKQNVKQRKARVVIHRSTRSTHSWVGRARLFLSNKRILRRK